ncbi:hypothetical protein [Thiolapillus brandeum]|uniref:Uncharacterized protein n=1 Tax=Thiolapillus brandeum TaxID=1076588 RepID=A0A7U6GKZ1_9GAMM|nr:hypothetical protein [Thiolapillus brandeum]BAO45530.1 hypothetical protein TBH_C2624 [Thiolapillus brandeum]
MDTPMDSMPPGQKRTPCALPAIAALAISAITLIMGYVLWHMPDTTGTDGLAPLEISGSDIMFDPHLGKRLPQGVEVQAPGADQQSILLLSRTGFQAEQYPLLHYRIANRSPGLKIALFWRSSATPETTRFVDLQQNLTGQGILSLEHNTWWKGTITDLGFNIQGGRPGDTSIIRDLKFSPPGTITLLQTILADWTSVEAWSMSSINFLFNASPHSRLSPVVATACWLGLALLLYAGWNFKQYHRLFPRPCRGGLLLLIAIPWLMLYARWQLNYWTQLNETRQLYSGKTQNEKHLLAEDAVIYRYAQHLKNQVLPQSPARIIILRKAYRDYLRLKLQYYLLPHNSYNYDSFPQADYLQNGDYLLILGDIPGLQYNQANKRLEWTQGRHLRAKLLDESPLGRLYQVDSSGEDQG